MSVKKMAVAAALTVASSAVLAGGFDGPFVQAGLGFADTKVKIVDTGTVADGLNSSDTSAVGQIAVGYSQSFGDFNAAANVFYVIGDQKAGNILGVESKAKNTWGVSVEPGWNISKNVLGYAKLSYVRTTGEASADGMTESEKYHGIGYGAGVKYLFDKNVYAGLELQQVNYKEKAFTKADTLFGLATVGYKF